MNVKPTCSNCGAILSEEEICEFDGAVMCSACLESATKVCDNCGTRIWRDEVEGDDVYTLCRRCYDDCFTNCERCGRLISNSNACYEDGEDYPYCYDCYSKIESSPIKSYNYKPDPTFYGSGPLYYGIELEIDKGGEYDENAEDITYLSKNRVYCKHDGSINEGFEIVSHPMSLSYHTNEMNWIDILNKAISMNYRSHNTSTCGLHIHASRRAFGETYEEQEKGIGRVVYFIERHWNELVHFSRRTEENLNRWAARYATISRTATETYKKAKDKHYGRYVALNLENFSTIEFRMFRGTLRYKTFLATLQLVDEICNCAIIMNDNEMENMSWLDFVSRIPPKKLELIEYLKSKQLYVNSTSETTEQEEM